MVYGVRCKGFFEATAGVEEAVTFIGDGYVTPPAVVTTDGVDDHIGKMMDVDDDVGNAGIAQFLHLPLQQRLARHRQQRLWYGIGKRLETRAQARRKDQTMYNLAIYHFIIYLAICLFDVLYVLHEFLHCISL